MAKQIGTRKRPPRESQSGNGRGTEKKRVASARRRRAPETTSNEALSSAGAYGLAQQVVEHTPVAAFVLGPDHKVLLWNKACEALTGVSAAEMMGTDHHWKPFYPCKRPTLADIVIDGSVDELSTLYAQHTRSSLAARGLHAEGWYKNLNGKNRYILFDAAPIMNAKNDLVMVVETLQDIPEREHLEKTLEKAVAEGETEKIKTAAIAEAIGDGVSVQSRDFRILYQNQAHRDLFGNHVGRHCYEAYEQRPRVCDDCLLINAFEDGGIHRGERSSGSGASMRHLKITASSLKDASGKIIAGIEIVRDVTARKQAEDNLRLLQEAIEYLPIGISIVDAAGKIVYTNPAEADMHGYRKEELVGRYARLLAPKQSWRTMEFEKLHAMGLWKRESVNVRKNGEEFPVQLISRAVKSAGGGRIGVITVCEDVTERKRAEEKLVQRESALRAVYTIATTLGSSFKLVCDEAVLNLSRLLEVSHVAILRREHGHASLVSAAADGGLLSGEGTGAACTTFDLHWLRAALDRVWPGRSLEKGFFQNPLLTSVVTTTGSVVGAIVVMDRGGRPVTVDGAHLVEIFARYIASVIEREGMEARLRNAGKLEVIGKLAGGVAHEVRNPLNAIMVISEALSKDLGDNPEYQPYLVHIREQVNRLSALMRDLLDLGKPVERLDMRRESLTEICMASIDTWMHSGVQRVHTVRLAPRPGSGGVMVFADGRRLQQVLLNIFDNASQHAPEGSEITVETEKTGGNFCRIRVVDCGPGVAAEILPRIFEPFFSTRRRGTGLGMSIVKHIVEAHGGAVSIETSDPPPGCSVEIRLPAAEPREP